MLLILDEEGGNIIFKEAHMILRDQVATIERCWMVENTPSMSQPMEKMRPNVPIYCKYKHEDVAMVSEKQRLDTL